MFKTLNLARSSIALKSIAMENLSILIALLSAITIAAILKILRRHRRNLPPGPKPWPIIGNMNLIGSARHRSLHSLSQTYGDIMQLTFGNIPVVVVSSPYMAKQFIKVHDANFASRPPLACGEHTSYNYTNLLWAPYGSYWKQARKIFLTEVFSAKKLEFFEPLRIEESRSLHARLYSLSGKPVVLREHLSRYSLSVMSRIVFGDDCFAEMNDPRNSSFNFEELRDLVRGWIELNGFLNVGDWITWLGFLDVQGCVKRMKELRERLDAFHNYVIDDHLARMAARKDEIAPRDVVESLLQMAKDEASELEVKLTRDCIKGLAQDLIIGGTDTTATIIEWSIHEVMRHPHVIEKAKEELNLVIGRNRWVEESDISQLPYINAIIMEAMRLHPLAPLLPPHYAIDDCEVAGYDIVKGTVVFINTHSLGRDPNTWEAPEEFLPERFIGKDIDLMGGNFALLPFGSGRRSCPGYKLGLKTLGMTVANILHGFDLKLVEGITTQDICLDEVGGLIQYPKHPLPIIMEPTFLQDFY